MPAIEYTEHELATIKEQCRRCGEIKTLGDFCKDKSSPSGRNIVCKTCESARRLNYKRLDVKDYIARADKELAEFRDLLDKTATENFITHKHWLEVCGYFKKCAVCAENEIEAKYFLVPFKKEGKYCNYNIIPICLKCRAMIDNTNIKDNPFYLKYRRIRRRVKGIKDNRFADNIIKAIEYLERRIRKELKQ